MYFTYDLQANEISTGRPMEKENWRLIRKWHFDIEFILHNAH